MIKHCERHTCYNFFSVGPRKKYCSDRCSQNAGKTAWRKRNKEKFNAAERRRKKRKYDTDPEYRAYKSKQAAKYYLENPPKKRTGPRTDAQRAQARNYAATRYARDLDYRMRSSLRSRIRQAIKRDAGEKSLKTADLIGCSVKELRAHLEAQFTDGMSWDNYGDWHIDHIIPCASFDLSNEQEQRECFHYTNLQPLWGVENLKKGDKVV